MLALAGTGAQAQQFFRIGNGGTAGTYYPVGGMIANDAFFFVGGAPAGAIAERATSGAGIERVAIDGPQADALRKSDPFFSSDLTAANTYKGVAATKTLAMGAQWVTSDKADANTAYEITKALFGDAAQKTLSAGHAKGKFITKENAVMGTGIPFHPGAERFYKEAGLLT